jgi:hypothetical protein
MPFLLLICPCQFIATNFQGAERKLLFTLTHQSPWVIRHPGKGFTEIKHLLEDSTIK